MKRRMNLQLFEDGAGADSGNQGGNAGSGNGGQGSAGGASGAHAGTYTYEQLEEIASARVNKSERAALANFFRSQGMTEAEVTEAITQFKNERAANQPDTAKLQRERDDALKKVQQMENEKTLAGKGVKAEDLDYVMFKVSKLVDDKTTFEKAAEKYLKENPRFTAGNSYRMTSSSGGNSNGSGGNVNASINDAIRMAARR